MRRARYFDSPDDDTVQLGPCHVGHERRDRYLVLSHPLSCAGDRFHCPDQRFGFRGNEGRASAARPRARNSLAVSACGGGFAGFTSAPAGTALAFFALNLASCLVAMSFALSSTSSPLGDPSRF